MHWIHIPPPPPPHNFHIFSYAPYTPTLQIVEHWACCKLASSPDLADEELCDVLVAKLSSVQGVRYAAVATKAEELGRRGLAALLLDQEQVASEQVPLLLGLHEYQRYKGRGCVCVWCVEGGAGGYK